MVQHKAIEPIIGHLKSDHRMGRCYLKGQLGDSMNAVLAAAGYNIRWLLRQIVKKGLTFLEQFFCACKKWGCRQPQHASICCKRSNHG